MLECSDELKPCPFCGGCAQLRDKIDGRDETFFIHCNQCHMNFEKFEWRGCGAHTVITQWNKRDVLTSLEREQLKFLCKKYAATLEALASK